MFVRIIPKVSLFPRSLLTYVSVRREISVYVLRMDKLIWYWNCYYRILEVAILVNAKVNVTRRLAKQAMCRR